MEILFGARPPIRPPNSNLKFHQNSYFYISKNSEKNTDIHEGITHMCVNFQFKIHWNEGCVKKTNMRLFNTWYRSQLKVFHHEFLHTCELHPYTYSHIWFQNFLKHKSLNLNFSKIKASMELGLQNAIFIADMLRTTLTCISKDRDAIFFSRGGFLVLLNPLNMEHVALL